MPLIVMVCSKAIFAAMFSLTLLAMLAFSSRNVYTSSASAVGTEVTVGTGVIVGVAVGTDSGVGYGVGTGKGTLVGLGVSYGHSQPEQSQPQ